jgi:methyl-branched lipid omega-hydroxylase
MADGAPGVDEIDLSSIEFWAKPWAERDAAFATLRRERPVAFFDEPEVPGLPVGPGYYAITRHADVLTASRTPEVFCSGEGALSILDMPADMNEFFGSMLSMDDPRHARLRKIVSGTFTPKMLNRVLDDVAATARDVVAAARGKGVVDFVAEVSSPFPLIVVCDLMGIPDSERQRVLEQSNIILSGGDPEFIPEGVDPITAFLGAGTDLVALMDDLAADRRADPTSDLTSALVNTSVDGEQLSGQELASFFILLSVAGHETTRTGISHAITLLGQNPDQRAIWQADVEGVTGTAVEEVVRIASPVIWMRRTLTRDAELSGTPLKEGDKVLLYYGSANRDEAVFDDPDRFDVLRDPNPHVGFGGPGPHFCLGAHLARREIALLVGELFRQIPDWQLAGEPEQLRSSFVNGIKHLPVDLGS